MNCPTKACVPGRKRNDMIISNHNEHMKIIPLRVQRSQAYKQLLLYTRKSRVCTFCCLDNEKFSSIKAIKWTNIPVQKHSSLPWLEGRCIRRRPNNIILQWHHMNVMAVPKHREIDRNSSNLHVEIKANSKALHHWPFVRGIYGSTVASSHKVPVVFTCHVAIVVQAACSKGTLTGKCIAIAMHCYQHFYSKHRSRTNICHLR